MDKKIILMVIFSIICSIILTQPVSALTNGDDADCGNTFCYLCFTETDCLMWGSCAWNEDEECVNMESGANSCDMCTGCPETACGNTPGCKWVYGECTDSGSPPPQDPPPCTSVCVYDHECDNTQRDTTCGMDERCDTRDTYGDYCELAGGVIGACVNEVCTDCSSSSVACPLSGCGYGTWTGSQCCGDDGSADTYCSGGYTACYTGSYRTDGDFNSYVCGCGGGTWIAGVGCCGDDSSSDNMHLTQGSTCYYCYKGSYGEETIPADYCSGSTRYYNAQCTDAGVELSEQNCNSLDTCVSGQATFRDYYCSGGGCLYTDRDRDGAQSYCITTAGACNAQTWVTDHCCGDDGEVQEGGSCTTNSDCCFAGTYCSKGYDGDLPSTDWHCCSTETYWDPGAFGGIGACREAAECGLSIDTGYCCCDINTDFAGFFADPDCFSGSQSCCYDSEFGGVGGYKWCDIGIIGTP